MGNHMQVIEVPGQTLPDGVHTAVTIGKFQGIHRGHQAVLRSVRERAAELGLEPAVVTFDRHPLATIAPDHCPAPLMGQAAQLELFADAGMAAVCVLRFDRAMMQTSPEDFARTVIRDAMHAELVLVGPDFRFGSRNAGDVPLLRALGERRGFTVEEIPLLTVGEEKLSSSRIRTLLGEGDVAQAARDLGRLPELRGVVVHGFQRGRALGFPTANLGSGIDTVSGERVEASGFVPADGVYAGWLLLEPGGERFPAAVSVGTNPTFDGRKRTVEAHIPGRTVEDLDLYGRSVRIQFVERLRPMRAFSGVAELIETMRADVAQTSALLRESGAVPQS